MKQILTDSDGNIFESFDKISEDDANKLSELTQNGKTLCELSQQIKDRDEILKLALYSEIKGKEPIAEIDEVLLKYYG